MGNHGGDRHHRAYRIPGAASRGTATLMIVRVGVEAESPLGAAHCGPTEMADGEQIPVTATLWAGVPTEVGLHACGLAGPGDKLA